MMRTLCYMLLRISYVQHIFHILIICSYLFTFCYRTQTPQDYPPTLGLLGKNDQPRCVYDESLTSESAWCNLSSHLMGPSSVKDFLFRNLSLGCRIGMYIAELGCIWNMACTYGWRAIGSYLRIGENTY